ncbi:hypothetical protein SAMN04488168_112113 [Bacillus sp. 491mf]|nr:hypothetical protein SAMN04488168_112113 [Bacillus sp. 491mf]
MYFYINTKQSLLMSTAANLLYPFYRNMEKANHVFFCITVTYMRKIEMSLCIYKQIRF